MTRREYFVNGNLRNHSDELNMTLTYRALGTKNIEAVLLWDKHLLFFSRDAARNGLEMNMHVGHWIEKAVNGLNPWVVCGTVIIAPLEDFPEATEGQETHA